LDQLQEILAVDMQFRGPFHHYHQATDYINSLKSDPPENFRYEMIKTYSDDTSACLVYRFSKPGIKTIMTQIFEVKNDKITHILLVFDTKDFRQDERAT
jgi:hypothetical protein